MDRGLPVTARPGRFAPAGDEPALPDLLTGDEPGLAELVADPVLQTLMRRDHLSDGDFWAAVERGRAALRRRDHGDFYASFMQSRLDP